MSSTAGSINLESAGNTLLDSWRSIVSAGHDHRPRDEESQPLLRQNPDPAGKKLPGARAPKLGTFSGCFVPTTLNVISILVFLRFTFIVGQVGLAGTMLMLSVSYLVNLFSTLSISAICTNGVVRKGGAYYAISRSLGPEFGGSIGIMFFLGQILNTGMNVSGFAESLLSNFGKADGEYSHLFPQGFVRMSTQDGMLTTSGGISYIPQTIRENLWVHLTRGAAGSERDYKETFSSVFGVFYPATAGIFAGASMSGDLKHPSRSIPRGTLYSLFATFILYFLIILSIASSVPRETLYTDQDALQDVNISPYFVLVGALSSALFSAIMGIVGAAKLLEAIAGDHLLPGLSLFEHNSEESGREPYRAIFLSYILVQITLFSDINALGAMITMTFLLTFGIVNLACFLLRIGSAPNFRPMFRYFSRTTAFIGLVSSFAVMFYVDGIYATTALVITASLFAIIHYTCSPESQKWGDVTQSLIYHQLRKYLLRLDRREHVKFWRPQILLFVNDPVRSRKLIQFCNSLKKGSLFVLGNIIVHDDFRAALEQVKSRQQQWQSLIDTDKIKAFIDVTIAPSIEWGARNLLLESGLGGMRPNIAVIGFYDRLSSPGQANLAQDPPKSTQLSGAVPEKDDVTLRSWMHILEDLLSGSVNVMLAKDFKNLQLPTDPFEKSCIDLWPIQMSSIDSANENVITTNIDTYTMILQCGCILHTVPSWTKYTLRVFAFVEYAEQIEEERARLSQLLRDLRITAELHVLALAQPENSVYATIVHGSKEAFESVDGVFQKEQWWVELKDARARHRATRPLHSLTEPVHALQRKNSTTSRRRRSVSNIEPLRTPLTMRVMPLIPAINDESDEENASDGSDEPDDSQPVFRSDTALSGAEIFEEPLEQQQPETDAPAAKASMQKQTRATTVSSFNDVPSRAQYLILNQIMTRNSRKAVITFTTLPAPRSESFQDAQQSLNWVQDINIMTNGLGPVALVHSKSLTVTTSL